MTRSRDERFARSRTRLLGNAAACGVLMLTNLFAPAALADDLICHSKADVNCDWIVDGEDLSYLLGAWGSHDLTLDLDGDCSVGGSDLAIILGNWGALPPVPEWQDIYFDNDNVSLCMGGDDSVNAVINGTVVHDPYYCVTYGNVSVDLENSVYTTIDITGSSTVIFAGMSKVSFDAVDTSDYIDVNGYQMTIGDALTDLNWDMIDFGMDVTDWFEHSQAMMALAMLHQSPAYADNMVAMQAAEGNAPPAGCSSPGFWCKAAAIAAGAAITALATAGCAALLGSCAIGTAVTFGGIAIPCSALIGLCAGGVFAGGAASYELALAYWGG